MYVGKEVCCFHLQSSDVGSFEIFVPVNLTTKYWLSYVVSSSFCNLIPILFTQENKTNNLNADITRAGFEPTVCSETVRYHTRTINLGLWYAVIGTVREILGSPKMPRAW